MAANVKNTEDTCNVALDSESLFNGLQIAGLSRAELQLDQLKLSSGFNSIAEPGCRQVFTR